MGVTRKQRSLMVDREVPIASQNNTWLMTECVRRQWYDPIPGGEEGQSFEINMGSFQFSNVFL